ncbi:hypothetical protein AB0I72_27940 [Nocardiopsis sp. NPDC049922]|uniref:hypothetical protein n=1 Tax=Nocardiopsis sp. NPDC049922 TaxID=3155157 RepID=UPI0033E1F227
MKRTAALVFVTMAAGAGLGLAATPAAAHDHFDGYRGYHNFDFDRKGKYFDDHRGDHGQHRDHGDHHWWGY